MKCRNSFQVVFNKLYIKISGLQHLLLRRLTVEIKCSQALCVTKGNINVWFVFRDKVRGLKTQLFTTCIGYVMGVTKYLIAI
jgi:hypothetical protein